MGTEGQILLWWSLFAGTHVGGSSRPVRRFLIERLGLPGFKGVYSLVSLATFLPLVFIYFGDKHAGPALFRPTPALWWTAQGLMLLALVVLLQALATPNPLTTAAELSDSYRPEPAGIQRVTRHPMNTAFALYGAAHCMVLPFVGDWLFFGGFVVFAPISAWHQDARGRESGRPEVAAFQERTSALPFAAILGGRQRLVVGEFRWIALALALALFVAIRQFHGVLFGGFGA